MKMTKIFWVCMLAAVFSLTSCIKDIDANLSDNGEAVVTLITNISEGGASQSRALDNTKEQTLSEIAVIAFDNTTPVGNQKFLYVAAGSHLPFTPGANGGSSNVTISFPATYSDNQVNFIVIANATAAVNAAITACGGTTANFTRSTFLAKAELSSSIPTTTANPMPAWNTGSSYTPIPMYAEAHASSIKAVTNSATLDKPLVRMLARINVELTTTAPIPPFVMEDVRLFNYNRTGNIVSGIPTSPNAMLYNGASNDHQTYTGSSIKHTIYAFERTATAANPVVLIIGGKYDGGSKTYYRLDFVSPNDNLVRNNSYNVTITTVSGPGFPTVKEAYESVPVNMTANITKWADGGTTSTGFDKPYTLNVGPDIVLNHTAHTGQPVSVTSDYTSAPTHALSASPSIISTIDWLTGLSRSGSSPNYTYTFNVTANTGATERDGYIHITAGNHTAVVKVVQKEDECTMYVGMFGGALKNTGGVYQFERPLYVQCADASESIRWRVTQLSGIFSPTKAEDRWNGRENTYILYQDSYQYDASELCYNKNTNANTISYSFTNKTYSDNYIWYLPAQNQQIASWVVSSSFDYDYKFAKAAYWSSSEVIVYNAQGIEQTGPSQRNFDFTYGNAGTLGDYLPIRCVRETK